MNAPRLLFLTVSAMAVIPAAFLRAQGAATAPAAALFLEYRTIVPAGWCAAMPSSTVRLAEYRVPATNGAIPVEIVVYCFWSGTGRIVAGELGPMEESVQQTVRRRRGGDGAPRYDGCVPTHDRRVQWHLCARHAVLSVRRSGRGVGRATRCVSAVRARGRR